MDAIRTFIAVDLSAATRSAARKLIEKLRPAGADVNWVEAKNMHLTLKFLGEVPSRDTPDVCKAVAEVAAQFEPLTVTCRGAGAFPDLDRPRTVWLGIEEGKEELAALQAAVDDAMLDLGFPREHRSFHPHLTLGRVKQGGPALSELSRLLEKHAEFDAGESDIDEVIVFASFLDRHAPPTYRPMGRGRLGNM